MGGSPLGGRSGRMVGVVMALSMVAACGFDNPLAGDRDITAPTSATTAPSASVTGASTGSATGSETSAQPGSTAAGDDDEETIEDLEAAWAQRRAEVVLSLSAERFGIDPEQMLVGPDQFEVDLSQCPEGWSDTAGTDPATIKIGLTVPQSGDQAAFNELALGMRAYFDWVNSRGGVAGRQIQLVVKDDGYDPALTAAAVSELLTVDPQFYVTTVGSPGALAVYGTLNDACVPQPFVASSHPALGDPLNHPWTTGLQMSYTTEALLWGAWIEANLADEVPVTVGALVIDNEFGQVYADAFKNWADANRDIVSEVTFVRHDPSQVSVTKEMAEIAELAPEVFISMTNGEACASAVDEAGKFSLAEITMVRFTPSVCTQPITFMASAGEGADGFYAVGPGLVSTNDSARAQDTFVAFVNEHLTTVALDPGRELVGVGFAQYGWAHVEMLRIASELPGGLTRSNLLLALRGANLDHPMAEAGVRFATSGAGDAFFIEGAAYNRYDAAALAWYPQGPAVDLDGTSPNCVWTRGVCKR